MPPGTKYFDPKCLKFNLSEIKKDIKKICTTDEVCNVNNHSILEMMTAGGLAHPKFYSRELVRSSDQNPKLEKMKKYGSRHTRPYSQRPEFMINSNKNNTENYSIFLLVLIIGILLFMIF